MRLNILKKITALGLCIPLIITGCSNGKVKEKEISENASDTTYKIGISAYMEHPSLDAAREGFIDEMVKLGIDIEVDYVNAQGDTSNTQVIAEKFVKDKVDLIYSIATLSTQAAKKATEKSNTPVLFTAVTDPVYSQIVKATDEIENVTGVTDKVEPKEILKLAKDLKDGAKVIGIIYNTGESNSEIQIEEVKVAADELDMIVETVGITSVNDIPQAMNTLAEKIDVLYMISDNMVASAIQLVANLAIEKNIITLSTIESQAEDGILISNGLSYTELGRQAAAMAKKILVDKEDIKNIHIESPTELKKIVNVKTMEALGLTKDNKAFVGAEFVE